MSLDFFNNSIKDADPEVYETLKKELERQQKEDEWTAFKEKLDLTNWVEDIVLGRFQN